MAQYRTPAAAVLEAPTARAGNPVVRAGSGGMLGGRKKNVGALRRGRKHIKVAIM